ncbi:hypothetical protein RJT34_12644 [Clitoria ternatea]|uniref:Uncharacterized protein n=1 Tax=Clitoria ternatea TaxID=43366 RepID=A0AAN9JP76_CLITE
MQLLSIQRLFSTIFSPQQKPTCNVNDDVSHSAQCIDLSNYMDNTDITLPTLNGWLLGYPVVNNTLKKGTQAEELLSLSVPYDQSSEEWAKAFLAHI